MSNVSEARGCSSRSRRSPSLQRRALGVSATRRRPTRSAKCGTVTLDENAWAGATANVYVAEVRAREEARVQGQHRRSITESQPLFQAMADGKVDVVPRTGTTST